MRSILICWGVYAARLSVAGHAAPFPSPPRWRYNESMADRILTALPVYNEIAHVSGVLDNTLRFCRDVLVVDDGSDDGTAELLMRRKDLRVVYHPVNRGYGAAIRTAFSYAVNKGYDVLVTIDCDGQHQPQLIPRFVAAARGADVVSGSRYLRHFAGDSSPPEDRYRINRQITAEINRDLGLNLTDAFCGFKAYRTAALRRLRLTETGYAMPLEFWVQAAALGLVIVEEPVPLIYLDESRSFGGSLDDAETRLAVYREVLARSMAAAGCPAGTSGGECPEG
jgi:glycosyltransferase involved in cell wall biosynthesis